MMNWNEYVVAVLAALVSGWMAFDGIRALITGDYVTPKSGPYAGQLGPWASLVAQIGIDPRSTKMKLLFAVYGLLWLAATVVFCFFPFVAPVRWVMFAAALGSLWYFPFGTFASLVQILMLIAVKS